MQLKCWVAPGIPNMSGEKMARYHCTNANPAVLLAKITRRIVWKST
jgi:hypothetical protein